MDPRVQKDREEKGLSNQKQHIDQDCECAQRDCAVIKRTIVEFCCGENSKMGDPVNCPIDTEVVRLTIKDDVSTEAGLNKARAAVGEPNCMLWSSIPCTGGSPWQWVNRRLKGGLKRLRAHRKKWKDIWRSFAIVARECHELGGRVVIEWPKACTYWKEKCVQSFIKELGSARRPSIIRERRFVSNKSDRNSSDNLQLRSLEAKVATCNRGGKPV